MQYAPNVEIRSRNAVFLPQVSGSLLWILPPPPSVVTDCQNITNSTGIKTTAINQSINKRQNPYHILTYKRPSMAKCQTILQRKIILWFILKLIWRTATNHIFWISYWLLTLYRHLKILWFKIKVRSSQF